MMQDVLIRLPQVIRLLNISKSTIDRLEKNGSFPRRIKVGRRLVAWKQSEVEDWIRRTKPSFMEQEEQLSVALPQQAS